MTQYALVLDESYHAIVLRDLFRKEAQKHHDRWANATTRKAVKDNKERYEMYRELADRCEHIRMDRVAEMKIVKTTEVIPGFKVHEVE